MRLIKICLILLAYCFSIISSDRPGLANMINKGSESAVGSNVSDPFSSQKEPSQFSPNDRYASRVYSQDKKMPLAGSAPKISNESSFQPPASVSSDRPQRSLTQANFGSSEGSFGMEQSSFEQDMEMNRSQFQNRDMSQEYGPQGAVSGESADQEEALVESALNTIETSDEGNWVLKRVWWEQSQATFDNIIDLNDKIVQLQMNFVNQRSNFDKKINSGFKQLGLEQIEIEDLINYLLNLISNASKDAADSTKEELDFLKKIESKKEDFENLNKYVLDFYEQDNLLSESLVQLMQLVNECREYERKSWEDFKEIGKLLNDEKAKELYYQIESNYKNIESIYNYINGELSTYLNTTFESLEKLAQEINDIFKKLESKDLNIKNLVQEHKEILETKSRMKEISEQKPKDVKKKSESKGFFSKILEFFGSIWKKIKSLFGFK